MATIAVNHTTIDIEAALVQVDGKPDFSPFNPSNNLVSCGYLRHKNGTIDSSYFRFHHKKLPPHADAKELLQEVLDDTEMLVGHNIKMDLMWLLEYGFKYDGPVFDTMIAEYVINNTKKLPLGLTECCERYGLEGKLDIIKKYMDKGVPFDLIPWRVIEPYGMQDIRATDALFLKQLEKLHVQGSDETLVLNKWWSGYVTPSVV